MSNTDDLEAACKLVRYALSAYGEQMDMRYECDKAGELIGRSLAQPPSSEVISAGNAIWALLKSHLHDVVTGERANFHPVAESLLDGWEKACDAALAHPKDPAPTVEAQAGELSQGASLMAEKMVTLVRGSDLWRTLLKVVADTDPYEHEIAERFKSAIEGGYLRPSQAIGEQTPVDEDELIRQMKNAPMVLVPAMSSEARDKAKKAIDRIREIAGTKLAENLPMVDPGIAEIRKLSGDAQHYFDQALSALRGS